MCFPSHPLVPVPPPPSPLSYFPFPLPSPSFLPLPFSHFPFYLRFSSVFGTHGVLFGIYTWLILTQVLVLRWTAETVFKIFDVATTFHTPSHLHSPLGGSSSPSPSSFLSTLIPFRDASVGPSTYGLTVLDCWKGLIKANSCGFFDLATFDPNEYVL